jgi:RNA polymerase sigma factor (sigma-70 family)
MDMYQVCHSRELSMKAREQRFESLYREHYASVLRYAARRVASGQEADVVAETFTIAWQRLDQWRDGDGLPWLYGIARKVLANDRRGRYRRLRLADRIRADDAGCVDDHASEVAQRVDLLAAIDGLKARDRECLQLAEWEQLSPDAAAVAMGCSTSAYKVRLHRARRRLAARLAAEDSAAGRHPERPAARVRVHQASGTEGESHAQ